MKRLLIHGDPGVRKDDVIAMEDDEYVCFSVTQNGDWHGPHEVQLWCVIGAEDERHLYEEQRYIPHFLETESIDAGAVEIVG